MSCSCNFLDIDQSIPINDSVSERMCQSTIRSFIKERECGVNRVNLFLDIPIFNQIMIPTK